jgi:hypothetical protein
MQGSINTRLANWHATCYVDTSLAIRPVHTRTDAMFTDTEIDLLLSTLGCEFVVQPFADEVES